MEMNRLHSVIAVVVKRFTIIPKKKTLRVVQSNLGCKKYLVSKVVLAAGLYLFIYLFLKNDRINIRTVVQVVGDFTLYFSEAGIRIHFYLELTANCAKWGRI